VVRLYDSAKGLSRKVPAPLEPYYEISNPNGVALQPSLRGLTVGLLPPVQLGQRDEFDCGWLSRDAAFDYDAVRYRS
jgi:hypothetical protein